MARLLDPKPPRGKYPFAYTSAAATDIRETFKRVAGTDWNKPKKPEPTPKVDTPVFQLVKKAARR
jgi:hypothetical protein